MIIFCWLKFVSIFSSNRITLISNRVTGPGVLSFEINEDVQVYVHAPNEVPHSVGENVFYGSNKEIIVSVKDIVNDPSVKDISIANRKCRFPSERENLYTKIYEHYSHSTCTVECSMDIQIKLCNCSHHSMPRPRRADNVNICDIEGLICLTNNFGKCLERIYWLCHGLFLTTVTHSSMSAIVLNNLYRNNH